MYVLLPTYRHSFVTNPFLFKYELLLTNQESIFEGKGKDIEILVNATFAYIFNPAYIF